MTSPQYQPQPQHQYQGYPPAPQKTNTLAIIALVASFFISLAGVIMGHIALGQIKRTGEGGRGLAIAALVIGYASMAIGLVVFIIMMGAAASQT
jgi:Domain of unknown function (DUF4190)